MELAVSFTDSTTRLMTPGFATGRERRAGVEREADADFEPLLPDDLRAAAPAARPPREVRLEEVDEARFAAGRAEEPGRPDDAPREAEERVAAPRLAGRAGALFFEDEAFEEDLEAAPLPAGDAFLEGAAFLDDAPFFEEDIAMPFDRPAGRADDFADPADFELRADFDAFAGFEARDATLAFFDPLRAAEEPFDDAGFDGFDDFEDLFDLAGALPDGFFAELFFEAELFFDAAIEYLLFQNVLWGAVHLKSRDQAAWQLGCTISM